MLEKLSFHYDADGVLTCEVTLSPVEVSKLEKEISADRLKKIHRIKNNKLRIINWAIVQFILFFKADILERVY